MIFTLTNLHSGLSYMVSTSPAQNPTLETVWDSQKYWFMNGTPVRITAEDGRSRTFIKSTTGVMNDEKVDS